MPLFNLTERNREAMFAEFRDPNKGDVFSHLDHPNFGGVDPSEDTMAEFSSLVYAVHTAGERFRMISLGAAPGEWPLRAERAFRKKYPNGDFKTFCIEGDLDHFEMMRDFFHKNGASLTDNISLNAVIAKKDGWAYFPIINPDLDWGAGMAALSDSKDDLDAKIDMDERSRNDRIGANGGKPLEFRTVEALSLATVLDRAGTVDYVHSDIQGAEMEVFPAEMDVLTKAARICCIGTHAASIEEALLDEFDAHGWRLECAFPCKYENDMVMRDGVHVWSNPKVGPTN